MSSASSSVFRMYKKTKQYVEPNEVVIESLRIAAAVNLTAVSGESEDALTHISEVTSTTTNAGEFLEGTLLIPSGPLPSNDESDAENLAGSQVYFYYA